jgi:hypothetical protein
LLLMHPESPPHVVEQLLPLHVVYTHGDWGVCVQPPLPLQVPTGVTTAPVGLGAQLCVPHAVPDPGYTHVVLLPLHEPAQVPLPEQAARPPTGAPVMGEQVPGLTLHATHCAVQLELQQ